MVPKLHAKGRSFRGAAAYLLHDKNKAKTCERVAWTETRNLASDDPQHAWRIMAATAMDQARLKDKAGVKKTGRKSNDAVLHLTLSWHPDEKPGLSREEMMRAALGALRALSAEDRQVLFVSHDDEPQPHLHMLLNRVSPADGRMLSSSKEKLALSRWAEAYEKERGQIRCEERVINNAARKRGEYTRGQPDKPRHIYELEAANDNHPDPERVRSEQRKKDADAAKRGREVRDRQQKGWRELVQRHRARVREIKQQAGLLLSKRIADVRGAYRPEWKQLYREQQASIRAFERRESTLIGRVQNAIKTIDFGAILRSGQRRKVISEGFQILASAGARAASVKRQQEQTARALGARQNEAERQVKEAVRAARSEALAANRKRFQAEQQDWRLGGRADKAVDRAVWSKRTAERKHAWESRIGSAGQQAVSVKDPNSQAALERAAKLAEMAREFKARSSRYNRGKEPDQDQGR